MDYLPMEKNVHFQNNASPYGHGIQPPLPARPFLLETNPIIPGLPPQLPSRPVANFLQPGYDQRHFFPAYYPHGPSALPSHSSNFGSFLHLISSLQSLVGLLDTGMYACHSLLSVVSDIMLRIKSLNITIIPIRYIKDLLKTIFLTDMENVWSNAISVPKKRPNKIKLLFQIGLIFIIPYLIKSFKKMYDEAQDLEWCPEKELGIEVLGNFDFRGGSEKELSFKRMQRLRLAPGKYQRKAPSGWVLASDENNKKGFIPTSYIYKPEFTQYVKRG